MGSKAAAPPPTVTSSGSSNDQYLPLLIAMMSNQQNQASNVPAAPTIPDAPVSSIAETVEPIDWTQKQAELKEKVKTNFAADMAVRKGLSSTQHTSPLVEEEDTNSGPVSSTILGGS